MTVSMFDVDTTVAKFAMLHKQVLQSGMGIYDPECFYCNTVNPSTAFFHGRFMFEMKFGWDWTTIVMLMM